jgi:hypothetical protein
MLDHLHRHRRQVNHLPPLHTHLHSAHQIRTTPQAQTRLMPPPLVWAIDQRQRRPRMTGLPTRLATAPATQRLRSRLGKRRVQRRRLRRIPTVLPQLPPQLGDLGPQQLDLLSLPPHQRRKFLIGRASIRRHHAMIDKTNEKINQPRRCRPDQSQLIYLFACRKLQGWPGNDSVRRSVSLASQPL